MTLISAILLMSVLGLILGIVVGLFVKWFHVQTDPRMDLVLELLPGANCGGCGKAGCADFARAVVSGEELPSKCPVSSTEQKSAIAMALGIDAGETKRLQAVVFCRADIGAAVAMNYNGIHDCTFANQVAGGPSECRYGCLGMGSCARKCPFGAIEIINNVAVVHRELCVGCGSCVEVCPRHVIRLVPAEAEYHIYCNSPEKGAVKRSYCHASCIGCSKCAKLEPDKFKINGFLAQVNYDSTELPGADVAAKIACPVTAFVSDVQRYHAANELRNGDKEK